MQLALYSKLQLPLLGRLRAIASLHAITISFDIAVQAFLHQFGIY